MLYGLQALSTSAIRATDPSRGVPYTSSLKEASYERETSVLPAYRVLDNEGKLIDAAEDPMVSDFEDNIDL